jgi:asparagine synthase (glutamine-hydrolysing)
VLVFNGEIYNHVEIRQDMEKDGVTFRGSSDTEVLLALIESHGVHAALKRSTGMFAIAVWDTRERMLYLARDRFGEKPLYYGWHAGRFLFGSELKALITHPCFSKEVDRDSLGSFCHFAYIGAPYSIFRDTYKIPPGHVLSLSVPDGRNSIDAESGALTISAYWSPDSTVRNGRLNPFKGSFADAVTELDGLLSNAVGQEMQADVPLGAFLSGGVDSSTVVAMMQARSARPVRTYSIGFHFQELNEAYHAAAVARHLGTKHTELYVSSADALAVVSSLPEIYDEPFGDSSQIPTLMVAKLARKDVTVSLSGDGGDEIFGGYGKYQLGSLFARLPFRGALCKAVALLPWAGIERVTKSFPGGLGSKVTASRIETLHALLLARDPRCLAETMSSVCRDWDKLAPEARTRATVFDQTIDYSGAGGYESMAMLMDIKSYLPDDILVKVDRATMAVGLESRSPFLDHRILEFVATLPIGFLRSRGASKRILREVLYRYVPRKLVDRPKTGFNVPLAHWLRGDMREWMLDMLAEDRLRRQGYLDAGVCASLIRDHMDGRHNNGPILWALLMFQLWVDRWL